MNLRLVLPCKARRSSNTLQKAIDRTDLGVHHIGRDIQSCFDDLRGHEDSLLLAVLSKPCLNIFFLARSILGEKTAVQQHSLSIITTLFQGLVKRVEHLLRSGHAVADN